VQKLVLLAPAFGFARRWQDRLGPEGIAAWRRTGKLDVFHHAEKRTRQISPALLDDALAYEDYPDFHQPALIFHGAKDDVVPAEFSREFAGKHSNARLEILDSGHELTDVLNYMAPQVAAFLL